MKNYLLQWAFVWYFFFVFENFNVTPFASNTTVIVFTCRISDWNYPHLSLHLIDLQSFAKSFSTEACKLIQGSRTLDFKMTANNFQIVLTHDIFSQVSNSRHRTVHCFRLHPQTLLSIMDKNWCWAFQLLQHFSRFDWSARVSFGSLHCPRRSTSTFHGFGCNHCFLEL